MRFPRHRHAGHQPRVGLVLGAGGITAIAWMVGALDALRQETGWDPARAHVLSGTSAGAVVATVLASGLEPQSLLRYAEDQDALDGAIAQATDGRGRQGLSLRWPGSLALGVSGLLATSVRHRITSLAGFLPHGLRSTAEIRGLTHAAASRGWPSHTSLWIHACDYGTGRRVTFGRDGEPSAPLGDAVAASCAVPGYYEPVEVGDRRYVDGGLWSFTNADALVGSGCDVVICLSPFSTREHGSIVDTAVYGLPRTVTTAQRGRELQRLRDRGAEVVVIEPSAAEVRAMGLNPMDRSRSREVLETARAGVAGRLDGARAALADTAPIAA